MDKNFIRNFLKGSMSASTGTLATILFHFFSLMLMSRYVPKEDFGIYLFILVIVHCLKILGSFGFDLTLVRAISSDNADDKRGVFEAVLLMRAGQLALVCALFYFASPWLMPYFEARITDYLHYIPFIVVLASYRELFFYLLQGLQQFKQYAIVQVASAIIKFAAIALLAGWGMLTIESLLWVEIIAFGLSFLHQLLVIPLRELRSKGSFFTVARQVIVFSIPLYLNNILTFIYGRISVIMIAAYINPIGVAYYEIAQKIPEAFTRMFQSFIVVYFPNISKLFSQGKHDDARLMLNRSLTLFSIGITFLVLIAFFFGEEIVALIFSDKYATVSLAFSLLMLNFYLRAIANLMGYSLVSAGFSSVPVKVNTISSIINCVGSVMLIPAYGFIGAVYSLLIMNTVAQGLFYLYLVKANLKIAAWQYLKPLLFAGALVGSYKLIGIENFLIKCLYLGGYLAMSWMFIREFRSGLQFFAKFLYRLKPGWGSAN